MDTTMPDHVVDQPKGSKGFKPGKGGPSPNPSGVAVPDGGVITAEKMRKVLGQGKNSDSGPTESRLRKAIACCSTAPLTKAERTTAIA